MIWVSDKYECLAPATQFGPKFPRPKSPNYPVLRLTFSFINDREQKNAQLSFKHFDVGTNSHTTATFFFFHFLNSQLWAKKNLDCSSDNQYKSFWSKNGSKRIRQQPNTEFYNSDQQICINEPLGLHLIYHTFSESNFEM